MLNFPVLFFWLLIEIILLFFLSKFLINSLVRLFYAITKSRSASFNILAVIFLPGTIIHELSHLLVAGMMFVPVGEIDILPKSDGDGVNLGTVEVGETDMVRRAIIGTAPLLVGLVIIFSLLFIFQSSLLSFDPLWQTILLLYIVFVISNNMFSSKKDMEGAYIFFGAVIFMSVAILAALYFTHLLPGEFIMEKLNTPSLLEFLKKIDLFLLIPLGINSLFIGLTRLLPNNYR